MYRSSIDAGKEDRCRSRSSIEAESRDGLPVAGPKKYQRRKTEAAWKTEERRGIAGGPRAGARRPPLCKQRPRAGGDEIRSLRRTRVWKTNGEGETNRFF
jgi:hypothetical protein